MEWNIPRIFSLCTVFSCIRHRTINSSDEQSEQYIYAYYAALVLSTNLCFTLNIISLVWMAFAIVLWGGINQRLPNIVAWPNTNSFIGTFSFSANVCLFIYFFQIIKHTLQLSGLLHHLHEFNLRNDLQCIELLDPNKFSQPNTYKLYQTRAHVAITRLV